MSSKPIYVTRNVTINYLRLYWCVLLYYYFFFLSSTDVAECVRKHWVRNVVGRMDFLELVNRNWNVYRDHYRIELVFVWVSCFIFVLLLSTLLFLSNYALWFRFFFFHTKKKFNFMYTRWENAWKWHANQHFTEKNKHNHMISIKSSLLGL